MSELAPHRTSVRTIACDAFRAFGARQVLSTLGVAFLLLGSAELFAQVSVNRVFCSGDPCPKLLELIPGIPTRVNLRGDQLGRLGSGTVINAISGLPTRAINVQLGRTSRNGSRRSVTLTAQRGSTAGASLGLQFRSRAGANLLAPLQVKVVTLEPLICTVEVLDDCVALATCTTTSTATGFECRCPAGYSGNGRASGSGCTDINECVSGPCGAGELCLNTSGGFTCD